MNANPNTRTAPSVDTVPARTPEEYIALARRMRADYFAMQARRLVGAIGAGFHRYARIPGTRRALPQG